MALRKRGLRLRIQIRDIQLLFSLAAARVMTRQQAAKLHFNGKLDAARKRLHAIITAGYASQRVINGESILVLAERGFKLLQHEPLPIAFPALPLDRVRKQSRLSPTTIAHEIAVADIRCALLSAVGITPGVELCEVVTWPDPLAFQAIDQGSKLRQVKPDGFFRVRETDNNGLERLHSFFLEVDRSTESQSILIERAICYRNFYRSGEFAKRCGASADAYKSHPFRLLIVCRSPLRRNNLAQNLLRTNPRFRSQIWLSTFDEVVRDLFGPVWLTPKEFERAVAKCHSNRTEGDGHPTEQDLLKQQLL